jgi:hypothetical protein
LLSPVAAMMRDGTHPSLIQVNSGPQYRQPGYRCISEAAHRGASASTNKPTPQPISNTRFGARAAIRATVASSHSRISLSGRSLFV